MKSTGVDPKVWTNIASISNRSKWQSACWTGVQRFEDARVDNATEKRRRRKDSHGKAQLRCHVLEELCVTSVTNNAPHAHMRTHGNWCKTGAHASSRLATPYRVCNIKTKALLTFQQYYSFVFDALLHVALNSAQLAVFRHHYYLHASYAASRYCSWRRLSVSVCASVHRKSRKLFIWNWCNLVRICPTMNATSGWKLVTFDLDL